MEFYRDCNGVVECLRELLITHLNVVKNYCFCVVFFCRRGGEGGKWRWARRMQGDGVVLINNELIAYF